MTAGTLPAAEWQRMARAVEARAFDLWQNGGKYGRGWQSKFVSLTAQVELLTGMALADANKTAELFGAEFMPTLNRAKTIAMNGVPDAALQAADEFRRYTGGAVVDPVLMQSIVSRTGQSILHDWDRLTNDTRDKVATTISGLIGAGAGPRELGRVLGQETGFPRWRGNTIARTEYMSAQDDVRHAMMGAAGITEWVWRARSDACPLCFALHGTVFAVHEAAGRHPNCRCIMVPKVDGVKMPKPNSVPSINERFPKHLQMDPLPKGGGARDMLMRRLVVAENPKWKPTWKFAPKGTTKFVTPKKPLWQAPTPELQPQVAVKPLAKKVAKGNVKPPPDRPADWVGRPRPKPPVEPTPPQTVGAVAFDAWTAKVKTRFAEFAAKTGNPKNDLTKSNNWPKVQSVSDGNDPSTVLTQLLGEKYIDQALYDEAMDAWRRSGEFLPGTEAAYRKAMDQFLQDKAKFDTDLAEWKVANNVTAELRGMGKLSSSNRYDAKAAFTSPRGEARNALQTYTGGSYRPWNQVLRDQTDGTSLPPPGSKWRTMTEQADEGFSPAKDDLLLRRGTGWHEFADRGGGTFTPPADLTQMEGKVFQWRGYVSSSYGDSAAFGGEVEMVIRAPKGTRGTFAEAYSLHTSEREVILKRGQSFFIHKVEKERFGYKTRIEVEVLPEGENPADYIGLPTSPGTP